MTAYAPPGGRTIVTVFGDSNTVYQVHAIHRPIVSYVTGTVYHNDIVSLQRDRVEDGPIRGTITGRFIWPFYAGDVGPDGKTFDRAVSWDIVGRATYIVDAKTWATLAISIHGRYTNIRAALEKPIGRQGLSAGAGGRRILPDPQRLGEEQRRRQRSTQGFHPVRGARLGAGSRRAPQRMAVHAIEAGDRLRLRPAPGPAPRRPGWRAMAALRRVSRGVSKASVRK